MAKEIKENIEEKVEKTTEVAPVEEETCEKPKFITKVVEGVKKHGKKIAVGAALAAATVIGYALVKKSGGSGNNSDGDYDDDDAIDVEISSEESID